MKLLDIELINNNQTKILGQKGDFNKHRNLSGYKTCIYKTRIQALPQGNSIKAQAQTLPMKGQKEC